MKTNHQTAKFLVATTAFASLFLGTSLRSYALGPNGNSLSFILQSDDNCQPSICHFAMHNTNAPLEVQPGDSVQYDIHLDLIAIPSTVTFASPYIAANIPQNYNLVSCDSSLGLGCSDSKSQVYWDNLPTLHGGQIYDFYFNVGIPNDVSLCDSSIWLMSIGYFSSSFVNMQTKPENGVVRCPTSTAANADPNPATEGQPVILNASVSWNGKPVGVGSVDFTTPDHSSSSGYRDLGRQAVDGNGNASIQVSFAQGTYTIHANYSAPGSGFLSSSTSFILDVEPVPGPTPSPSPSASPNPTPTPGHSPNPTPTSAPSPHPTPSSSHHATHSTPTPLPATGTETPATVVKNGTADRPGPPRRLPELHVLNAGTVLALQALNVGPLIGGMDLLAVMGLAWHIRRRVTGVDDD
jgi:cell division septation protein DedD